MYALKHTKYGTILNKKKCAYIKTIRDIRDSYLSGSKVMFILMQEPSLLNGNLRDSAGIPLMFNL